MRPRSIAALMGGASSAPPPARYRRFPGFGAVPPEVGEHLPALFAVVAILVTIGIARNALRRRSEAPVAIHVPVPDAAKPNWTAKDQPTAPPRLIDDARPNHIQCHDPATAQHLAEIEADTRESVAKKVALAQRSQPSWAATGWAQRRRFLRTLKKWIVDDTENIARAACRDTGKTAIDAVLGEILTTVAKLDYMIQNAERVLAPETRPNSSLLLVHKRCRVLHEPLGVVAACVSWNYPCHNALSPIIAALASGNAIVVKASEMVAWSSQYFIAGVHQCLSACGADPNVVQLVCCFPEAAEALTRNPTIRHITFIGSEPVGKLVAASAATSLTATCMELGGKDPMVVLPDCDLDFFVPTWLRAAFGAAGQNCIGAERFIVPRKLLPRFFELVEPRVRQLRCGSFLDDTPFRHGRGGGDKAPAGGGEFAPSVDVGAMISDARLDALESLVADAVKRGARCLVGGKRWRHEKHRFGSYFAPTLIVDVTSDMRIAQEELFAPVLLVMSYGDSVDEAVELANSCRYALGSSVFGRNRSQCHDVARRLHAGMVNINDFAVSYLNQALPFGGVKSSGYGRFGGHEGLLSLTATKAVTEDVLFRLVRTSIPPRLDYPLADPVRAWRFASSLVALVGAQGYVDWVVAALALAAASL